MKKVGILILNYNNIEDTINCVSSIFKFTDTALFKLLIVDNGSPNKDDIKQLCDFFEKSSFNYNIIKEGEYEESNSPLSHVTLLTSSVNSGYAQGNNKGLTCFYKDPEIDYVLILNSDILFYQNIIPDLIIALDNLPDSAIVSPLVYKEDRESIDHNCARRNVSISDLIYYFLFFYFKPKKKRKLSDSYIIKENPHLLQQKYIKIELPSGACMLMKKQFCQEIGGFDPNTFLYYEENILLKKIEKKGKSNYLLPELGCIHLGQKSTLKEQSSFVLKCSVNSAFYYAKNYESISWYTKSIFTGVKYIFLFLTNCQERLKSKK